MDEPEPQRSRRHARRGLRVPDRNAALSRQPDPGPEPAEVPPAAAHSAADRVVGAGTRHDHERRPVNQPAARRPAGRHRGPGGRGAVPHVTAARRAPRRGALLHQEEDRQSVRRHQAVLPAALRLVSRHGAGGRSGALRSGSVPRGRRRAGRSRRHDRQRRLAGAAGPRLRRRAHARQRAAADRQSHVEPRRGAVARGRRGHAAGEAAPSAGRPTSR